MIFFFLNILLILYIIIFIKNYYFEAREGFLY